MLQSESPVPLRAAFEWLVQLNDDRAPPDLRGRFEAWLTADPEHHVAWNEVNALWSGMEPVKAEFDTMRRKDRQISRRRMLGVLAGAAVVGSGGWHVSRPWFGADYTTVAGQTQDITLADGSVVNLGSRSAIALDFGGDRRGIRLLRGEAFFSVAADRRPFVVSAMGGTIRATTSRFNVNLGASHVSVAVAEDSVSLQPPDFATLALGAGWASAYRQGYHSPPLQVELASIGAWRQGRLFFQGVPLAEVLAEIERWRGGSISIWNADAAAIPVTGIFDTKEPALALDTIVQTLGLRMVDLGGITVIRAG